MIPRQKHKKNIAPQKRQRDAADNPHVVERKSRRVARFQARLPDYLVKHKDAASLRELLGESGPEIQKELYVIIDECSRRHFDLEYLYDWLAIYRFLREPELVLPFLDQLEDQLQQRAANLGRRAKLQMADDHKLALPELKSNPYERRNILSRYIYDWAHDNGFQQQAKFISLLSSSDFLSLLRAKTIFKDSSVSADIKHGAWSHALQWYCIVERQKKTAFLHHQPLQVLRSFGDQKQLRTARSQKLAWDMIVDNPADVFFCSPVAITAYMIKPESMIRWPLLAGTVARQENKANLKFGSYGGYTKYLRDKHDVASGFILKKL